MTPEQINSLKKWAEENNLIVSVLASSFTASFSFDDKPQPNFDERLEKTAETAFNETPGTSTGNLIKEISEAVRNAVLDEVEKVQAKHSGTVGVSKGIKSLRKNGGAK